MWCQYVYCETRVLDWVWKMRLKYLRVVVVDFTSISNILVPFCISDYRSTNAKFSYEISHGNQTINVFAHIKFHNIFTLLNVKWLCYILRHKVYHYALSTVMIFNNTLDTKEGSNLKIE